MRILRTPILTALMLLIAAASAQGAWPIKPQNGQHVIRGSFMDGRATDYHHGIDIPVDDLKPERGAPSWASHRVYAVQSGTVSYMLKSPVVGPASCSANRFAVGNLIYYHVAASVSIGQYMRKGAFIGWTCRKRWHIHLTEGFGDQTRNPLRPGGRIVGPYTNTISPIIENISFWTPCDGRYKEINRRNVIPNCGRRLGPTIARHLPPNSEVQNPAAPLKIQPTTTKSEIVEPGVEIPATPQPPKLEETTVSGLIDVRYDAYEPQGMTWGVFGSRPWLYSPIQPYSASLNVARVNRKGESVRVIVSRTIYTADWLRGQKPMNAHWAPGFRRWLGFADCAGRLGQRDYEKCKGRWVFRAFALDTGDGYERYWDTTKSPNGRYRIRIGVKSHTGKHTFKGIYVTVQNPPTRRLYASSRIEQPAGKEARYRPHAQEPYSKESGADIESYARIYE